MYIKLYITWTPCIKNAHDTTTRMFFQDSFFIQNHLKRSIFFQSHWISFHFSEHNLIKIKKDKFRTHSCKDNKSSCCKFIHHCCPIIQFFCDTFISNYFFKNNVKTKRKKTVFVRLNANKMVKSLPENIWETLLSCLWEGLVFKIQG